MVIDKLWSGRFSESVDAEVEAFTASHSFDRRLIEQDILGSCAHAKMLLHCGILTKKECDCKSISSITISKIIEVVNILVSLSERVLGRVIAENIKNPVTGEVIIKKEKLI